MNHSALHSVFQTNQSNNQQSNFEAVQSGKKKKKQKMVRADPSLLGEHRPEVSAGCWGRLYSGLLWFYESFGGMVFNEGKFFFFFLLSVFLGLHPKDMELPRLGV